MKMILSDLGASAVKIICVAQLNRSRMEGMPIPARAVAINADALYGFRVVSSCAASCSWRLAG